MRIHSTSKHNELRTLRPASCTGEQRSADARKVAFAGGIETWVRCQLAARAKTARRGLASKPSSILTCVSASCDVHIDALERNKRTLAKCQSTQIIGCQSLQIVCCGGTCLQLGTVSHRLGVGQMNLIMCEVPFLTWVHRSRCQLSVLIEKSFWPEFVCVVAVYSVVVVALPDVSYENCALKNVHAFVPVLARCGVRQPEWRSGSPMKGFLEYCV